MRVKINKTKSLLLLAALAFANLFVFQNCAPPKANDSAMVSNSSSLAFASSVKTDGRCGNLNNTCAAGDFLNVADSTSQSLWKCNGTGGGLSILCSANFSNELVNGKCDTKLNLCLQGKSLDQMDSSSEYFWQCTGFNGGTTDYCRIAKSGNPTAKDGKCGTTVNNCEVGNFSDIQDTSTNQIWSCSGLNGGVGTTCNIPITTGSSAVCGSTVGQCSKGTSSDVPDLQDFYLWKCTGSNNDVANCSLPKPKCVVSVQARTHAGDNFTYNMAVTNGFLPLSVIVKTYGTHTNPDGTNYTVDANGGETPLESVNGGSALTYTATNNGASMAGTYNRHFAILDASSRVEICHTNPVDYVLTPACGLTVDNPVINATQTYKLSYNFAVANELPLSATPSNVVWYGQKKNASGVYVNDLNGTTADSASTISKTFGPFTDLAAIGDYKRWFIAKSSNNVEICKSNKVDISITNIPAPVLNPNLSTSLGVLLNRSTLSIKGTYFSSAQDNIVTSDNCTGLEKIYDGLDTAGGTVYREVRVSFPVPTVATSCNIQIKRSVDGIVSNVLVMPIAFVAPPPDDPPPDDPPPVDPVDPPPTDPPPSGGDSSGGCDTSANSSFNTSSMAVCK